MTPSPPVPILVGPERLERWLARFGEPSEVTLVSADQTVVRVAAPDGRLAECQVPFPPLAVDVTAPYAGLLAHAATERRVGVLLVRLGGYAAGVFAGSRLTSSKVGSRYVHGRNSAGGWSQQRFARRREAQARLALAAAADVAARVLVPAMPLDAVVLGGDRRSLELVLEDPRLASLRPLVAQNHVDVPDPRLRVLERTPAQFRAVRVRVSHPAP